MITAVLRSRCTRVVAVLAAAVATTMSLESPASAAGSVVDLDAGFPGYCHTSPAWPATKAPFFFKSFGPCSAPGGAGGTWIALYERVGLVEGYVDGASRTELSGWVNDPDGPTAVHIYTRPPGASGFTYLGAANQTLPRPDAGGTFGWRFVHTFAPGTTVRVYGIGVRPNGQPNDGRNPQLSLSSGSKPLDIVIP